MAKQENKCFYCGKPIKGTLKKFHDDRCKDAYHSEKRRADRLKNRAITRLEELSDIRNSTAKNNRVLASKYLYEMHAVIISMLGSKWQCSKCGDEITSDTMPVIACRKCHSKDGFINIEAKF